MSAVRSVDGRIISDHVGVHERWAEYFEQLYQLDHPSVSLDARDVAIPWAACSLHRPQEESLYTGAESVVKCGGSLSSFFPVSSGVRQDYVLAPTLFKICIDLIMCRATAQTALDALSNKAKPLGLQVSWTKTKIQDFGGLLGEPVQSISACCENVEVTKSFAYLGSTVHVYRLSETILCGEGLCEDLGGRGLGSSTRTVVKN
ncbi:uncharacterized protein [Penaeus vannamei]|uniref:uncharacterized protein n=1 Tax=Penaeus vannamei TaxID=6689 RepID=UPI00387FAF8F